MSDAHIHDPEPTPGEEAPPTVDSTEEYQSLPKKDREELDAIIAATQEMQNEVDKWCGMMGGPVYFLAAALLRHELTIKMMAQENRELRRRLQAIEDSIS